MCLECGFYKGRQVIDLTSAKAKRDARIKAKEERIKGELGVAPETGVAKVEEASEPKEEKTPKAKKVAAPKKVVAREKKEKQGKSKE